MTKDVVPARQEPSNQAADVQEPLTSNLGAVEVDKAVEEAEQANEAAVDEGEAVEVFAEVEDAELPAAEEPPQEAPSECSRLRKTPVRSTSDRVRRDISGWQNRDWYVP